MDQMFSNNKSISKNRTEFSFERTLTENHFNQQPLPDLIISESNIEVNKTSPFKNLFKKKHKDNLDNDSRSLSTQITNENNNNLSIIPDSPTLSMNSELSNFEDPPPSSSSSKLSNKWQIRKHHLDKEEENDLRSFELSKFLAENYYDINNYDYNNLSEIYLFGNLVEKIFSHRKGIQMFNENQLNNILLNWLLLGGDSGEEYFELDNFFVKNIDIYALDDKDQLNSLLNYLIPLIKTLDVFKYLVSFFKENNDNNDKLKTNDNVNILKSIANKKGLPIPLSQTLFANWLIQFENFDNDPFKDENILKFFKKAARNSFIIKKLFEKNLFDQLLENLKEKSVNDPQGLINNDLSVTNQELYLFTLSFLEKDNLTALGLAFYGLGNSYHVKKLFNKAINLFEISSHLTGDLDCCLMASIGLSNGYGFGKRHGKENKFQRKKRIAQIYRIMKKNNQVLDVGTTWAFKSKYD